MCAGEREGGVEDGTGGEEKVKVKYIEKKREKDVALKKEEKEEKDK